MKNKLWDYIVVGTGMGAGPIGLQLAQAGYSVLFLEKGSKATLKGKYAEEISGVTNHMENSQTLKKAGRWSESISLVQSKNKNNFAESKEVTPFIGSGVGGSSALYGMVLERFSPEEIKNWPIRYSDLSHYYDAAERLFQVNSAETAHPTNLSLTRNFKTLGLETYSLPLAQHRGKNCGQCQGQICNCNCKQHSGNVCIEKAIQNHHAELLTECEVTSIIHDGNQARGVEILINGSRKVLKAKNVIVAAGALKTPLILQASNIGGRSGQLGRNLMRHFVDLYAVRSVKKRHSLQSQTTSSKEIGVRLEDGLTLQSFGELPPAAVIAADLLKGLASSKKSNAFFKAISLRLAQVIFPIVKFFIGFVRKDRVVLASILEDIPQFENRVWLENGRMMLHYKISEQDNQNITKNRNKIKKMLKSFRFLFIASAEKNEMLAHACGTARMGNDPRSSVVDSENRVHGFTNLYVTDASFFPTSGQTNPGLTIAANSLRVADLILRKMKSFETSIKEQV